MSSSDENIPLLKKKKVAKKEDFTSTSEDELIVPKKELKLKKEKKKGSGKNAKATAKTKSIKIKRKKTKKNAKTKKAARRKVKDEDGDAALIPGDARKYFREGQKFISPPNGDGTRAFYESLYESNSNSLISIKYCIEYGILAGTKHHEALKKYCLLKDCGAFKGTLGGINPIFNNGIPNSLKSVKKYVGSPSKRK